MTIRDARDEDAEAIAEVHVASWQQAYRGMLPDEYLDGLQPADRLPFWRERLARPPARSVVLLAEEEGQVLGFPTCCPTPTWAARGRWCPTSTCTRGAWGRGLGPALLGAAVDRARSLGYAHAELWTLVRNARARHVYEREGWSTDGTQKSEEAWGVELPEVRYTLEL